MADYAGDSTNFPANVRLPDDGLFRNAVELSKALIDLADRTAALGVRAVGLPGAFQKNEIDVGSGFAASGWTKGAGNQIPYFSQEDNSGALLKFNITPFIPYFSYISWFSVTIRAVPGHAALPSDAPLAYLVRYPRSGNDFSGSVEILGVAGLPSGTTLAQYNDNARTLEKSITPHRYNSDYIYLIQLTGEGGTNSRTGLVVRAVNFEVTG